MTEKQAKCVPKKIQAGLAAHSPQRAEQDQEKRSRRLFVILMISVCP
jgi:hypothetical protein